MNSNRKKIIELTIKINKDLNIQLKFFQVENIFNKYSNKHLHFFYDAFMFRKSNNIIDKKDRADIMGELMIISMLNEIHPIYNKNNSFNNQTEYIQKKYYNKFNSLIVS